MLIATNTESNGLCFIDTKNDVVFTDCFIRDIHDGCENVSKSDSDTISIKFGD